MYARVRRCSDDEGFTLIELLVVIIIIGILAAIAIPVFLSQRHKAHDAAAESDIRNVATAMVAYSADNGGSYVGANATNLQKDGATVSASDRIFIVAATADGYCLAASSSQGSPLPASNPLSAYIGTVLYWWDSQAGGLQSSGAALSSNGTGCPSISPSDITLNISNPGTAQLGTG